jgi:hypothetical protein
VVRGSESFGFLRAATALEFPTGIDLGSPIPSINQITAIGLENMTGFVGA